MTTPGVPSVDVYARPPLTFYLNTVHGIPTATLSDYPTNTKRTEDWIVIDEVLCFGRPELRPSFSMLGDSEKTYIDLLNITTLLDVDPGAAYGTTKLGGTLNGSTDWSTLPATPPERPSARILTTPQW